VSRSAPPARSAPPLGGGGKVNLDVPISVAAILELLRMLIYHTKHEEIWAHW
jgi:hypothetical protein